MATEKEDPAVLQVHNDCEACEGHAIESEFVVSKVHVMLNRVLDNVSKVHTMLSKVHVSKAHARLSRDIDFKVLSKKQQTSSFVC